MRTGWYQLFGQWFVLGTGITDPGEGGGEGGGGEPPPDPVYPYLTLRFSASPYVPPPGTTVTLEFNSTPYTPPLSS